MEFVSAVCSLSIEFQTLNSDFFPVYRRCFDVRVYRNADKRNGREKDKMVINCFTMLRGEDRRPASFVSEKTRVLPRA